MSKAKVFDMTAAQLKRQLKREASSDDEQQQAHGIAADMADGIVAVHEFLNVAEFKLRPRAFVLALAAATLSKEADHVALYDEELAELQNCDVKTVRRQREDYNLAADEKYFYPVEIIPGSYDEEAQKYMPTLYKFHLAEAIEQAVTEARASSLWHETDRRAQRAAIKRAAIAVYGMIPNAPLKRREKKRPRSAVAEIETCQKVILTKLERLKKMAAALPAGEREEIIEAWCERMRDEIEALQQFNSSQSTERRQVKGGSGQFVQYPPLADMSDDSPKEPEAGAAASATWERLEERLTTPAVRSVEIELHSPEWPPGRVGDLSGELEDELTLEEERAAIMQYDGGLRRDEAEALARGEVVNRRDNHAGRLGEGDSKPAAARDGPSG